MIEEAKMALLLFGVGFLSICIGLIYNYFNGKSN
jgi:hypothetical protein